MCAAYAQLCTFGQIKKKKKKRGGEERETEGRENSMWLLEDDVLDTGEGLPISN